MDADDSPSRIEGSLIPKSASSQISRDSRVNGDRVVATHAPRELSGAEPHVQPVVMRHGLASTPGVAAFPGATWAREPLHRRWLAAVGALYQWGETLLDRLVSSTLNPLYHTGTIAVFSLAVALVTGVYLFLFYRVGTDAAHRSIEGIMAHPWGIGSLIRSLHRYASDAAMLAAALHGLKMFLNDRFWGARWIGWVSGPALFGLVWITGATGYWLIWDKQAQVLSLTTAK